MAGQDDDRIEAYGTVSPPPGKVWCPQCHGEGTIDCPTCHGEWVVDQE